MTLKTISGGGRFEKAGSYSRVKRVGPFVFVAGLTSMQSNGKVYAPYDIYEQTVFIFDKIDDLLKEAGAKMRHIVRTRAFLTDMRDAGAMTLISDAMSRLFTPENQIIRVIGVPVRQAGLLIEVTMETAPLRMAMIDYGLRILILSAVISVFTALLLFAAVRRFIVRPIKGVVGHMKRYAAAPEDARGIIQPSAGITELREAEDALFLLQTELTQALKQKERLAQLGSAVAKISHDLRNILTSAQLFTDRIEASEDPLVRRLAPKLVNSITRAVSLCESTLAFGRAEEPPPKIGRAHV